jgi:hypothetical protein
MTDIEALAKAKAAYAAGVYEVFLPDGVFMPLSRLTESWMGRFAGNYQQRLTILECGNLVREAEYRLERKIVNAVIHVLES